VTEPEAGAVEPRPPGDHGQLPDDHPIMEELRRAGEIVRRINADRRTRRAQEP
jgi:hypothetical protein